MARDGCDNNRRSGKRMKEDVVIKREGDDTGNRETQLKIAARHNSCGPQL